MKSRQVLSSSPLTVEEAGDVNALKAPKRLTRISQVIHFPPSPVLLHTPHWEQSVTRETASQERGHIQYRGRGILKLRLFKQQLEKETWKMDYQNI